jgi:orotidine-5'-phosphate decarboxylase
MTLAKSNSSARSHLVFALDYPDLPSAISGVALVRNSVGVAKIGLELFVHEGPTAVRAVGELGCEVFLDLKLHDIPETVDRAVGRACQLGVRYLTLHASGGPRMLERAAARVIRENVNLTLLAVTVLTSLDSSDLQNLGFAEDTARLALRLAGLARSVGVGGCVCSPSEVGALRKALGPEMVLVTPGIRPSGGSSDDQKRTGTVDQAIRDGASLLVVGRPIRDAQDPATAAEGLVAQIQAAL